MTLEEWVNIGMNNGVVERPEIQEKTFEELYKLWFRMKMNVIRAESCDRIEVTYNRYYAGCTFVMQYVSVLE